MQKLTLFVFWIAKWRRYNQTMLSVHADYQQVCSNIEFEQIPAGLKSECV